MARYDYGRVEVRMSELIMLLTSLINPPLLRETANDLWSACF